MQRSRTIAGKPRSEDFAHDGQMRRAKSTAGHSAHPPHPPVPNPTPRGSAIRQKEEVLQQQRIFINDMQRYKTVEIGEETTAGDVVNIVASQGELERTGDWMLWEIAKEFGMDTF